MRYGDQSEVVEFLKEPTDNGTAEHEASVISTHISVVVLRGDRAWKLKRALKLPYADFSTPALRAAACEDEVRLNRRTAPTLYLGTRRITRQANGALAFDGDGEMIDAVVEMRRFDQETLFSRLAEKGPLDRRMLTSLARRIAAFHAEADVCTTTSGADRIAGILQLNEQCNDMAPILGDAPVRALRRALRESLERHRDKLDARAVAGRVRRCHGDLHLRNLCLVDGEPTPFDCLEFNESLATIDVLYDLAFLLMDLWHAGLASDANWVMNRYMDEAGDTGGLSLLAFFMALRASIRAQVLATQARMPDATDTAKVSSQARGYMTLAMQLLRPVPIRVLAIGGLSGSGKSTVAAAIAHRVGAAPGARILATDRIRKRLAGVPAESTLPPQTYTPESSERIYTALGDEVERTLHEGYSVIADAVFSRAPERQRVARLAALAGVPFDGIWLEADPQALLTRVSGRRNDPSDATRDVVLAQLHRNVVPTEWTTIAAGGTPETTARNILAVLGNPDRA